MPLILLIDTAQQTATIAIGNADGIIAAVQSDNQMNHAAFIHKAIKNVLQTAGITIHNIDAVAVSNGPGSYTGLRVGLSTAKGLCYTLHKPLILINTLEIMAAAMIVEFEPRAEDDMLPFLYCPLIDARRLEVFTAIYDKNLQETMPPQPVLLTNESFGEQLLTHKILFSGSGAEKFENIITAKNAFFNTLTNTIYAQNNIAQNYYGLQRFADVAYSEPYYLKQFYDTRKKV